MDLTHQGELSRIAGYEAGTRASAILDRTSSCRSSRNSPSQPMLRGMSCVLASGSKPPTLVILLLIAVGLGAAWLARWRGRVRGERRGRALTATRDELLDRGLDDMLMLSEMAGVAARNLGEPLDAWGRSATLISIGSLLESEYAIVGEVVKGHDGLLAVQSWNLAPTDAVQRIDAEWRAIGHLDGLGQVCWLELTDAGRAEAKRLRLD